MQIKERESGDLKKLRTKARKEWSPTGSRPTAVKRTRCEWLYLFAAVEPATGESVALQTPSANTGTMNVFLTMLAAEQGPKDHAVLIMTARGGTRRRN